MFIRLLGIFLGSILAGVAQLGLGVLLLPDRLTSSGQFWASMQGLCALVATSSLIGGALFTLVEYHRARDERRLGMYNDVFRQLMSDEQVNARRWVYQNVTDHVVSSRSVYESFLSELDEHSHNSIKLVLNTLDYLGFLVARGWLEDKRVLLWLHPLVSKSWSRLRPLVEVERNRRQEPSFYQHCDHLALRCDQVASGQRHGGKTLTSWLEAAL